jgi:hypothetical protein
MGLLRIQFGFTVQDDQSSETMKRSDCIFRSWGPSKSGRMLLKKHLSLFSHGPFFRRFSVLMHGLLRVFGQTLLRTHVEGRSLLLCGEEGTWKLAF